MELIVKEFDDLTTRELFEIYKLRSAVFVVEQNCPYQDVDDTDLVSIHVYLKDKEGIQAYVRVIPKGVSFDEVSLGRLITVKRRMGLGYKIMSEAIEIARERFNAKVIKINAQVYAISLYEKLGFVQTSDEYLDDGIPHIEMKLEI